MAISARNVPIPLTSPPEWVNNGDGTYTVTYIVRSGAQLLSIPFTPESMINGNGVPGNGLDNIFAELTTATASNMGLAILGQGQAGMFDSNFGGFVGSYVAINATEDRPIEGFWIIAPEDLDQHTFSVTGTLIDNNTAQWTSGTQKLMLTGLPIAIPSELDDLSTETFCNHNDMGELLVGITGEGASAMNQGGCGLVGSLLNFKPGQGYWLTANDPFTFNFTYLSDCDISTDWYCIGPCQFCDQVTENYNSGNWDAETSENMCNDAALDVCGGCIWTQACDCDGGVLDGCGICGSGICDDVDEDGICDCNDGCVSEGYDNLDPVTGLDCAGECNGTAELDCTGVCSGGNVCDGECFGCCEQGICVSNIWNGLGGGAELDCSFFTGLSSCGAGGMSCDWVSVCDCDNNVFDCLGICNGDALLDWCGVCNGDGTSCCDSGVFDECGVCDGPGPEYCHACPHPDFDTGPCICDIDADGICDDLDDCVWNGECEECTYYGNGVLAPSPSYAGGGHDCAGVCNGPGVMQTGSPPYDDCCPSGILDECGVCDGSGKEMCGCADLDGNDVGVCLPITCAELIDEGIIDIDEDGLCDLLDDCIDLGCGCGEPGPDPCYDCDGNCSCEADACYLDEGHYEMADTAELKTAVNMWINDNATALATYGEIRTWNTSLVTSFYKLFMDKDDFGNTSGRNDDISLWQTFNVTTLQSLFRSTSDSNADLSNWDVSKVTNMKSIFYQAYGFTGDGISNWDVSKVESIAWAFGYLRPNVFKQDEISDWDVSNVTNMEKMFYRSELNAPIENWNVSELVWNFKETFWRNTEFTRDISSWNVSGATNMTKMFEMLGEGSHMSEYVKCNIDKSFTAQTENWYYNGECGDIDDCPDWSQFCPSITLLVEGISDGIEANWTEYDGERKGSRSISYNIYEIDKACGTCWNEGHLHDLDDELECDECTDSSWTYVHNTPELTVQNLTYNTEYYCYQTVPVDGDEELLEASSNVSCDMALTSQSTQECGDCNAVNEVCASCCHELPPAWGQSDPTPACWSTCAVPGYIEIGSAYLECLDDGGIFHFDRACHGDDNWEGWAECPGAYSCEDPYCDDLDQQPTEHTMAVDADDDDIWDYEDPCVWDEICNNCGYDINGNSVGNSLGGYDECGVCNGATNTCLDCAGTPNGDSWDSDCGCVAVDNDGNDCDDCAGVANGTNWSSDCGCVSVDNSGDDCDDECGVPNGDNTSCMDCAGTPNGDSWDSDCGCVAVDNDGNDCDDCAGTPNGTNWASDCGCVVASNSGDDCDDCFGTPNGSAWDSDCGCVAADNDGNDCDDCAGTPNGTNWSSDCGCVAAANSGDDCDDCAGTPNGTNWASDCGCVAAANSGDDCDDCAGTPNGTNWASDCGCVAVDNSGDDCDDCAGTPNGSAVEDNCGTCDADASNDCVQDCAGTWGGSAVDTWECTDGTECGGGTCSVGSPCYASDACGVCGGPAVHDASQLPIPPDNGNNSYDLDGDGVFEACDCVGSVEAGCGCGTANPYGCVGNGYDECDGKAVDFCGVCGGDMDGNVPYHPGFDEDGICTECPSHNPYDDTHTPPGVCSNTTHPNDGGTCMDCNGVCGGQAGPSFQCQDGVTVACNVDDCAGQDCNDEWGGGAKIDDCQVCWGGSTGVEENSTKDDCGTCDGVITDCDSQCPANYGPWCSGPLFCDGENHWNTGTACFPLTFDCEGEGNNYCQGVCGHRDCVRNSSNCSTYEYAWKWRCLCDCDNSCNASGCPVPNARMGGPLESGGKISKEISRPHQTLPDRTRSNPKPIELNVEGTTNGIRVKWTEYYDADGINFGDITYNIYEIDKVCAKGLFDGSSAYSECIDSYSTLVYNTPALSGENLTYDEDEYCYQIIPVDGKKEVRQATSNIDCGVSIPLTSTQECGECAENEICASCCFVVEGWGNPPSLSPACWSTCAVPGYIEIGSAYLECLDDGGIFHFNRACHGDSNWEGWAECPGAFSCEDPYCDDLDQQPTEHTMAVDADDDGIWDYEDDCVSEGYDNLDPVTGLDCAGVCNGVSVLSGCDNACNSTAVEDCAGICSGDGELDGCGVCNGDFPTDYECGCNDLNGSVRIACPPTECPTDEDGDGTCDDVDECTVFDEVPPGGTATGLFDDCGVCNGPGTTGCDMTCGSTLEDDECDVCGGGCDSGCRDAEWVCDDSCSTYCDCYGGVKDCSGECGGSLILDECGICGDGECTDVDSDGVCDCHQPLGLWHKWGEMSAGHDSTCDNYCLSIGETCLDHDDVNTDGTSTINACPPIRDTQWWYNIDPDSTYNNNSNHEDHMGLNGIPDCDRLDYVDHGQYTDGATVNCTTIHTPPDDTWPESDDPYPQWGPPSAHGWKLCGDGQGVCKNWSGQYNASCPGSCKIMGGPNDGTSQRSGFYWYWPGAYPNECSCYNDPNSGGGGSGWSTIKHHAHGAVKHQTSYPQMGLEDWSDFDLNHPPPDHSQEYGIYWGRWSYGGAWYNVYERKSCSHYHALEYSNYGDSAENFCCCTNTQEHETYDHSTARADVDINQLDIISSNNECSYKECHGLSGKLYSDCCYGVDGDKGKCTLGYDCTGECGGDAIDCGCGCGYQCNDHNNNGILDCVEDCKGILDCAGLCNGGNKYDECGVCSGDNSCLN